MQDKEASEPQTAVSGLEIEEVESIIKKTGRSHRLKAKLVGMLSADDKK